MHGVFHTSLFLLQLGLSRCTHFDHRNATDQFCQSFLQLLPVIVRCGLFNLRSDLFDAAFNLLGFARSFNNCGVVLVDDDPLGPTQILDFQVFQFNA